MKKLLALISCGIISISVLAGCSILGGDDSEYITLEGIVTEQTPTDGYPGTHILTDDAGTVTPLTSISVKLSDPMFLNNKVEVSGNINDYKIFEVKSIKLVSVVEQTDKVGEFVSYENGLMGVKIKYYTDWHLSENSDSIILQAPTKKGVINSDQVSIAKTVYNYLPTTPAPKVNSDNFTDQAKPSTPANEETPLSAYFSTLGKTDLVMKKIGIENIDAVFTDDGFNRLDYYVYRPGYVYKISFIPSVSNYSVDNKNIFNKMVAEFKFIDFSTEIKNEGGSSTAQKKEVFMPKMDIDKKPVALDTTPSSAISSATSTAPVTIPELSGVQFSTFTSNGFKFSVDYPKNWYFQGTTIQSEKDSFLFPFSDKKELDPVLVGLYISKTGLPLQNPSCKKFDLGNSNESYFCSGESNEVFVKAGNKTFRLETTDSKYRDIMLNMAATIKTVE